MERLQEPLLVFRRRVPLFLPFSLATQSARSRSFRNHGILLTRIPMTIVTA